MKLRCRSFQLIMQMLQVALVYCGPMRNYTNGYHPAGGADPRYLNYGAGVVVPNLVNPRIPDPDISLTPRHHLERYIGVRTGSTDYEYSEEYIEDYYDEDTEEAGDARGVVSPRLTTPTRNQIVFVESRSNDSVAVAPVGVTDDTPEETLTTYNSEYDSSGFTEYDSEDITPKLRSGKIHCRDNARGYRSGEMFQVSGDPCTRCRCSRFGPQCNRTSCEPPPPGCFELLQRRNECCPVCLNKGCRFRGTTLAVGQTVQLTACEICECKEDGRVYCSVADCTPPPCVDATTETGQCCPVCPNGPNCYTSNRTIIQAINEWVSVPDVPCILCHCWHKPGSQQLWMGNRTAECKRNPRCNN